MTSTAKSLIIFFIFNIFCGSCKADAEYDKQVTAELSWIWGQLKSVMTPEEKNVERTVKLSYLSSELDVMKVRLSKTGELQFSFGAHVRAQEACTMSEYVRLLSTPNVNRMHLLQGYDSYLSNASDFGAFFLDARNYLRRVDGNTDYSALFQKVDSGIEVSACRTGLIAFLLAHEFAHAVSGDPVAMESLPADQVNILEQNADSRALELLARLKIFPIIGVSQFYLMVNHLMHEPAESKYSSFDHPLPFSRLVTALNFSIDNFEKHLDTKDRESLGISVAVLTTAIKGMRDQVIQWDKVQQKFIATSAKDDGLRTFFKNDITYAIRVPYIYLEGGHGSDVDLVRARAYFELATQMIPASFYYEQAEANYGAGVAWASEPKPWLEHACPFFVRADAMHLLAATKRLADLRSDGKCN